MSSKKNTVTDPIPDDIQHLLTEGKLDAVEEAWMARADSHPHDLSWFFAVAQGVEFADSAEMATILFQMFDDQLEANDRWKTRLDLLRQEGHRMFPSSELHGVILETLEKLYGQRTHYQAMFDKVGLGKAKDDIPKTWQKISRLEGLMAFDVGAIVRIRDKGAGRIEEINMALQNFKVVLEGKLELRVGFGGAAKLLEPLPEGHVLRRKLEDPDSLKKLAKDDPSELLRLVLEGEESSLTGAEIKKVLAGVVSPQRWNSFWNAARKHPQVITDPKNKRAYSWAESTADAHGTVWEAFVEADARERLVMLRRDGDRAEDLKRRMSELLVETAQKVRNREPGLAAEIWLNLDRSGVVPAEDPSWHPRALVQKVDAEGMKGLLEGVQDRVLREQVYALIKERREDWVEIYADALWQETEARSLDVLIEALLDAEPERFESFFDQLVSQPHKAAPAFTWLVERAADRPEWLARNPSRLMKQLLFAANHPDFAQYKAARLAPLLESGGTLPRLLDHLTLDQAETALDTVKRSPALEEYHREPLLNAIQLRFPELHRQKEAPLYATSASISAKRKELKKLAEEEIPENREQIESARELGDLRENFEYHAARRRHEMLSARAGKLDQDLRRVQPISTANVSGKEIIIGTRTTFRNDQGEVAYTILGPWESDPDNNVLSNESDLAKRLLGLREGDEAELPDGTYEVAEIVAWDS